MKIGPTGPSKGADKSKEAEQAPQGKPPGKEFKKKMDGVGRKEEGPQKKQEPPKKPPTPFDLKKTAKGKVKEKAAINTQQQAALAAIGQEGEREGSVTLSADVKASGFGSAVDKIISVFQNNAVFGSHIQALEVGVKGAETHVNVLLQNGVHVNVTLTGEKEVNIQIQGLTDAAQTAMDNTAHQQMLREQLAQQGFTVHQIQTFRGEGLAAALPPPPMAPSTPSGAEQQPFSGDREGEREGQRERQEEEEQ